MRLLITVVILLAAATPLFAVKSVLLSTPAYDITVRLTFTGRASPYEDGATFTSYSAIGRFNDVGFGPAPAEDFACWFQRPLGAGTGSNQPRPGVPALSINGDGLIENFVIAPAFETEKDEVPATVKSGPRPFRPSLRMIPESEALGLDEDSMPIVVPGIPTAHFRYSESYSITEPELTWEHENLSIGRVESHAVEFSVPVALLGEGKDVQIIEPYVNGFEAGQWEIGFWPSTDSETKK